MMVTSMHPAAGSPGGRAVGPALIGAFESTYLPGHGVDVVETTGHDRLWRDDVEWVLRSMRCHRSA